MTSITDAAQQIREYLDACFAGQSGMLHASTGTGPYSSRTGGYRHKSFTPTRFAYPREAEQAATELARAATDSDVYVCPYLMRGPKRNKGTALARFLIHADIDGQVDIAAVQSISGAFAVASGTGGHAHVYVPLCESLSQPQHELMCRWLGEHLGGADRAKVNDNDVLRVPGTLNFKPTLAGDEPVPVAWLVPPTPGVRRDPHELARELGHELPGSQADEADSRRCASQRATNWAGPVSLDPGELPEPVAAALALTTGDRSEDTARVVGASIDAGLTLTQCRRAVASRADLAGRLAERRDDDVLALWIKAIDTRQSRRQEQAEAEAFLGGYRKANAGSAHQNGNGAVQPGDTASGMRRWRAGELRPYAQPKFLATRRIPFGAVTILCGDEGIGKSLFWVLVVAAVTTGKPVPELGIPERDPADVILVLTEDDWQTDVLPRLTVAGADLDRIEVICTYDDGTGTPVFPDDMKLITEAQPVPALVVVDAWLDTVPPKLMVRDPQQSRTALHPWREAAGQTGAAVLLLTHSNRLTTANIRDRYGSTASLRQKARMTLYALADPNDGSLIIGPDKANNAPGGTKASRFTIIAEQHFNPTPDHDGRVPSLIHAGSTGKTIKQHLAELADAEQRKTRRRTDAELWLIEYLVAGKRKSVEVYDAGAKHGDYSRDQLKRASAKVARAFRDEDCWWWELLPEHLPPANENEAE